MTLTAATVLLYLVALFLGVATLWPFSYRAQTIQDVSLLVVFGVPFVMLIYFGFAFLIDDTISEGTAWLTSKEEEFSFTEGLVAVVSYVGLSGWLLLRWRNPKAPSTQILGPAIIATLIIFIIVSVIWTAHHDQMAFSAPDDLARDVCAPQTGCPATPPAISRLAGSRP